MDRISLGDVESLLSGKDTIEARLLFVDDGCSTMSAGSGWEANCLSSRFRR